MQMQSTAFSSGCFAMLGSPNRSKENDRIKAGSFGSAFLLIQDAIRTKFV